ncbi:G-protein alpha subunit-domain-containing protein [Gorgonomyces haynaldii]|nr:G-protein alpha subunit-domain-containing protein [Gorgonomyces haynaldii]
MSYSQPTSIDNIATSSQSLHRVSIIHEPTPQFPTVVEQVAKESPTIRKEKLKRSKEIDAYLKEEGKKFDPKNHLMILLLGPGDAGKSTVLKQMLLLHGKGFSDADRASFGKLIRQFLLVACQTIVGRLVSNDQIWESSEIEQAAIALKSVCSDSESDLSEPTLEHIQTLFLSQMSRILTQGYVPSDEDILNHRRKTENISETVIEIDKKFWHIVDVAGQKDKRARWTSYMEKRVTGVIYVFSCAAYNQVLEEERDMNRILDALQLFQSLVKSPILKLESVIILFNKYDLLPAKLEKYPIRDYLPDYTDKRSYMEWLQKEFLRVSKDANVNTDTLVRQSAKDAGVV